MSSIKKISNTISVAGQVTPDDLQQAATDGFKSVINLRSPQEDGFLDSAPQQAESVGLEYTNIPLKPNEINEELASKILEKIEYMPKPILIHCASATRASFIALMYLAARDRLSVEQVSAKAEELGFDLNVNLALKEFAIDYIDRHSEDK